MKVVLKVVLILVAAALTLAMATVWRNRVPLTDPPGLMTRLVTYFATNVAAVEEDSRFPELRPKTFDLPPDELFARVRAAVVDLGWRIDRLDPGAYRLHAVVTTPWLRFQDDVVVEIRSAGEAKSWVFAKSTSRKGRADYGANLRHILDLMDRLDQLGTTTGALGHRPSPTA